MIRRTGSVRRWTPSGHHLADGLTKDEGSAADSRRVALSSGKENLFDEQLLLARRSQLKEERLERGRAKTEQANSKNEKVSKKHK